MLISAFNAYQSDNMACLMLISVDKTWNRFISNRPLLRRRSVQLEFFVPTKCKTQCFRFISLMHETLKGNWSYDTTTSQSKRSCFVCFFLARRYWLRRTELEMPSVERAMEAHWVWQEQLAFLREYSWDHAFEDVLTLFEVSGCKFWQCLGETVTAQQLDPLDPQLWIKGG